MKTTIGLILAVAATLLFGSHYLRSGGKPKFRTAEATRGSLSLGVNATGMVEPVDIVDVGAQIVGCIKSFGPDPDKPGKTIDYRWRVHKGDVLAHLDDLPHKAELDKAKVNLQLAEAELGRFRTKQKQMERSLARATQLHGTISEAEFENAGSEAEIAKAEVAMAEAKVAQAKIAKTQAEINLTYTTISSNVDGVVIDRKVNVGQTVVAGMNAPSLFLLAKDLSHMQVCAAVNEADIGVIHEGQHVTFKVDTYRDRTFAGKVSQVRYNASLANSVVMYGVVVDVDNSDGKLLPYLTAKLQFEVAKRSNVILVPAQALRWQPTWLQITPSVRAELKRPAPPQVAGEDAAEEPKVDLKTPTVWVLAPDGLVRPIPVSIGLTDGIKTEIESGELEPGDAVVLHDLHEAEADFVKSFVSKVTDNKE